MGRVNYRFTTGSLRVHYGFTMGSLRVHYREQPRWEVSVLCMASVEIDDSETLGTVVLW